MYKVIIVLDNNIGLLQTDLNDAALEGYRWVQSFQISNRLVIVMSLNEALRRGPGRPKKEEEDNKLGK